MCLNYIVTITTTIIIVSPRFFSSDMDDSDDEFDDLALAKRDFQRMQSERFKV